MSFHPSTYQQEIFDWIKTGTGHAIINAVAGSGKTTTLVEASKLLPGNSMLFAAFNKHIVTELQTRLPVHVKCLTIHSVGRSCIKNYFQNATLNLQENKYKPYCSNGAKQIYAILLAQWENKIAQFRPDSDEDVPEAPPKQEVIQEQIEEIVSLIRCTLTDIDDLNQVYEMIDHFTIDCPVPIEGIQYVIQDILKNGEVDALERQIIDFADMLWLTYKWKLQPGKYDWVLVDETQDLNAAQLHLVMKMAGKDTRFLFVGDPCQAIYGFSGADAYSFSKIRDTIKATEFPLSICYRCPSKVIDLAKMIVPVIEAAPNCAEGEVITVQETDIVNYLKDGDLILCRSTEPLVRTCFKLLSKQINAAIKGKDIRKTLVGLVKRVSERENFKYESFFMHLEGFAVEKAKKIMQKPNNERRLMELHDQVNSIAVCYTSFNEPTIERFMEALKNLFSEDKAGVLLSTIHKAKGLEEDRIFILYPEKMPLKWDKQREWQLQQEMNLKYVALTRAKKVLYLVSEVVEDHLLSSDLQIR